jgi:hypothetical protein
MTRDEYGPVLRAAALGGLYREREGRSGEVQLQLLMLGWLEHDPAQPGCLGLTVTGEGELQRLPPIVGGHSVQHQSGRKIT